MKHTDEDDFYDEMDIRSTWKRGNITYLYDGMSGGYFYVGEVIAYNSDVYCDFVCELDETMYNMSDKIEKFCLDKFGIKQKPKIRIVNYVY